MSELKKRPCTHCLKVPVEGEGGLCEGCNSSPRCQVCEVFFDGLVPQSEENPKRCVSCEDMEEKIRLNCCICDTLIPLYVSRKSNVLRYVFQGNFCNPCNADARRNGMESRRTGEHPQFDGYLAFIEPFYRAGRISEEQWRYAIRMNRHDVMRWDGIEDLEDDFYDDVDTSDETHAG